ncbi:MAG: purQ, partial [Ilumatobacteraceae bacterium]|nr:purQ [Ilumatobacteraceae bacterium]
MTAPKALVLNAPGTNRDHDVAFALQLAGAEPSIVSLNELAERPQMLDDVQILVAAGGFSHADALGAGRMFAVSLRQAAGDGLREFVAA